MVGVVRFLSVLLQVLRDRGFYRGNRSRIRPVKFLRRFLKLAVKNMKVSLRDVNVDAVTRVVIESVDLSLYIAHAAMGDVERVITDAKGKVLKTRNLLEMQRTLRKTFDCEFFLRQRSAYDEMVGHQHQAADNCMEISLGSDPLPPWLN